MGEPRYLRRSDLIITVLFVVGLYVAWVIRDILLLIYVSIIFAVVLMPAIRAIEGLRIRSWRPGRGSAVLLLLLALLGVLTLFGALMLPPIVNDIQQAAQEFPRRAGQLVERLRQLPLAGQAAARLNPGNLQQYLGAAAGNVFNSLRTFFSGLANLFLLVLLVAYHIIEGRRSFDWAMRLAPARSRKRLSETLIHASHRVQRWLMGQLLLMLILASLSFVVFWALGVRYFFALAVFAGITNFVPIIGPLLAVMAAGLVAVVDSWVKLLGVLIFYFVYQQLENAYLSPRIMQSTVDLPGVAVIIALAVGAGLAGIMGAIVAVPSAALIATIIDEYMIRAETPEREYRRAG